MKGGRWEEGPCGRARKGATEGQTWEREKEEKRAGGVGLGACAGRDVGTAEREAREEEKAGAAGREARLRGEGGGEETGGET